MKYYDDANDNRTEFEYDGLNRFVQKKIRRTATSPELEKHVIEYGAPKSKDENRVVKETITTNYPGSAQQTVEKKYDYDDLGRLKKDTIDSVIAEYTYDAVGNRKTMKSGGVTAEYDYNPYDQLTHVKQNNVVKEEYEYDLSGNQTEKKIVGSDTTIYEYNTANWLKAVKVNNNINPIAKYTYDAKWQRIKKLLALILLITFTVS